MINRNQRRPVILIEAKMIFRRDRNDFIETKYSTDRTCPVRFFSYYSYYHSVRTCPDPTMN